MSFSGHASSSKSTLPASDCITVGVAAAAVAAAVVEPELTRDAAAEDSSPISPQDRPASSLKTIDEVSGSSSDVAIAPTPSAALATAAPSSDAATPFASLISPKRSTASLFSDSQTGLPSFTSTPIAAAKEFSAPEQSRKRIAKLFQTSSLELTDQSALLSRGKDNSDVVDDVDVTIKPIAEDAEHDSSAKVGFVEGIQRVKDKGFNKEGKKDSNEEKKKDSSEEKKKDVVITEQDVKKDGEEDGYTSSILEGYNDLSGACPADHVKSDEEIMEDNLLYGDLGGLSGLGGGVNDPGLIQFDFTDDEFDEISRRLLGEDEDEAEDDFADFDASPPLKRRKQDPLSPIMSPRRVSLSDSDAKEDEDKTIGDDNNNEAEKVVVQNKKSPVKMSSAGIPSTSQVMSQEAARSDKDLVVVDEVVVVDGETTIVNKHASGSSVICLGSGPEDGSDDDAVKAAAASASDESFGIPVEDYDVVECSQKSDEGAASAATGNSLSASLKRKGQTDSLTNDDLSLSLHKGPKIKRVVEVKGQFRWDVFPDSNIIKDSFDKNANLEEVRIKLTCALGGDRLVDPIRASGCSHLEALDSRNIFTFLNVCIGHSDCPLCGVGKLVVGGRINYEKSPLFADFLFKTKSNAIITYRDGTWDPDKNAEVTNTDDDDDNNNNTDKMNKSVIRAETIQPEESGPKVIQIYGKDGGKKTVKIENEDQMMRLVGEKWDLTAFPQRDKNRTVSNFRLKRLKKSGQVLVGRSLIERNESPLYQSNEEDANQQKRLGRKRKRTVEEVNMGKRALIPKFIDGVMERQMETLEKEYKQGQLRMKQQLDLQKQGVLYNQRMEVQRISADLQMRGSDRHTMYMVGREMRTRHDLQVTSLEESYMMRVNNWENIYHGQREQVEQDVRREITRTTQSGIPGNHKADIAKRGEGVDDTIPAVFVGGNEKTVKTTFLPIDCVEAILKENEAYRRVYGMDDKLIPKPKPKPWAQ